MIIYHAGGLLSATMDPVFGRKVSRVFVDPFQDPAGTENRAATLVMSDPRYSTDLFASAGINAQFGHFERRFLDFTKVGVRLDIGAVSAMKNTLAPKLHFLSKLGEPGDTNNEHGHPTLALSLRQQVLLSCPGIQMKVL